MAFHAPSTRHRAALLLQTALEMISFNDPVRKDHLIRKIRALRR
jgi:hypothetical protein